jgi:hypothetical protein
MSTLRAIRYISFQIGRVASAPAYRAVDPSISLSLKYQPKREPEHVCLITASNPSIDSTILVKHSRTPSSSIV